MNWEVWDMNLKNSLFEKGLIKADLRRFGIFSALYAALIFFSTFFGFYMDNYYRINHVTSHDPTTYYTSELYGRCYFPHFCAICAGGLLAVVLFRFLNTPSAISFYHGMPLKRRKIYLSKLVSAFILLTVPVLVVSAIVFVSKLLGSDINLRFLHLLIWTGSQLLYSYIAFACITFTAMFTGSILSHAAIMLICSALPAVVLSYIDNITGSFLYGYSGSVSNLLSYIYITPELLASKRCVIYIIATVILLTVSYFIYKFRDLEKNGEAFVFKSAKNVFVALAALFGGIFSYWYFSIWFKENIFWTLPFGLVAIAIANMINKRRITFKGVPLYAGIFLACVLAVFGGFKYDIFGYERRVPDINRVVSVSVNKDYPYDLGTFDNETHSYLYEKNPVKSEITAKEDILKVINFHKYRVKNHHEQNDCSINIDYTLKNGRHLIRYYYYEHDADREYIEPVTKIDKWVNNRYRPYGNENAHITYFTVTTPLQIRDESSSLIIEEGDPTFELIKDALQKDIKALPYDEDSTLFHGYYSYAGAPAYISIHYRVPLAYADGSSYTGKESFEFENRYIITDGFVSTLAALRETEGFSEIEFTADKVKSIAVDRYDENPEIKYETESPFDNIDTSDIITDRADIEKIINTTLHEYKNSNPALRSALLTFELNDGNTFGHNMTY
jgi:ABC-2 type transport system permease protein